MKEYCAKCHSEVDETEFSQNQAEFKNQSSYPFETHQVLCSDCLNSE